MKQKPVGYSWQETIINSRKQPFQNIDQNGYSKPCTSQVKQSTTYTSAINKHLQKYTHTENLQNIQYTKTLNRKSKYLIYLTECVTEPIIHR